MDIAQFQFNSFFQPFVKSYAPDTFLFRQGESGKTMFFILTGTVRLIATREGNTHVAAVVGAGQCLGEKAIVYDHPHNRIYSAQTITQTKVLELSLAEFTKIQKRAPELMIDILKASLKLASDRLERGNHLAGILRTANHKHAVAELIIHYSRVAALQPKPGSAFYLNVDSIHHHIEMNRQEIHALLEQLIKSNLLVRVDQDLYTLTDEKALSQYFLNNPATAKAA